MRTMILGIVVAYTLVGTGWTADDPRVFVVGAVNRAGVFHYKQGLTVESVINRAGGVRHLSRETESGPPATTAVVRVGAYRHVASESDRLSNADAPMEGQGHLRDAPAEAAV